MCDLDDGGADQASSASDEDVHETLLRVMGPLSGHVRHFSDKRGLLVTGQETLSQLLAEGIAEAPADASPLEAIAAGLVRASSAMGPTNRDLGPRLKAAVAASVELQERDALKSVGLAAAMTAALVARGVADPIAHLAGELGVLAFKRVTPSGPRASASRRTAPRRTPWRRWMNCGSRALHSPDRLHWADRTPG
jgi:hypothetical protein